MIYHNVSYQRPSFPAFNEHRPFSPKNKSREWNIRGLVRKFYYLESIRSYKWSNYKKFIAKISLSILAVNNITNQPLPLKENFRTIFELIYTWLQQNKIVESTSMSNNCNLELHWLGISSFIWLKVITFELRTKSNWFLIQFFLQSSPSSQLIRLN